ncbi:MAG: cysteine desulfurase family protein [Microbacterium gubbeenense]|uniref:cysteine desulfurase family protein n=1 Tax=Microbacterium gubbeenense TaxID=159896 RepID=UPI003F99D191
MIYLDHAATSPVRREVLEAMTPFLTTEFGNPSSAHAAGERARAALTSARHRVARHLGARAGDIVFTSGGTESNNLAVKGIAVAALAGRGLRHVVTTAVEHSSVLESVAALERIHGIEASVLPVDRHGLVDPAEVDRAIRDDTSLVSVQYANNEVGTVQDIDEIRAVCAARAVPLHLDAVQAAGWLPLARRTTTADRGDTSRFRPSATAAAESRRRYALADAVSLSGHKIGAPKGTGVLMVRQRIPLEPLLHGGGQERGRRSGTESVAGAVAMAAALDLAEAERTESAARIARVRDEFVQDVLGVVPAARLTGHPTQRLAHIASFTIEGINGEAVLTDLERRGVLASSGSACSAASEDASHVLLALGSDEDEARTAIRFSLSARSDDLDDVARALAAAAHANLPARGR